MWSRQKVYVCAKNVLGATKALRLGAKRTVLSGFKSTKRLLSRDLTTSFTLWSEEATQSLHQSSKAHPSKKYTTDSSKTKCHLFSIVMYFSRVKLQRSNQLYGKIFQFPVAVHEAQGSRRGQSSGVLHSNSTST